MSHYQLIAHVVANFRCRSNVLYDVLVDYREAHPAVMPKQFFESMTVTRGGVGAATEMHVVFNLFGNRRSFNLSVSEPIPGSFFVEEDELARFRTEFTIEPLEDERNCCLKTEVYCRPIPGLVGNVENSLYAIVARRILEALNVEIERYLDANRLQNVSEKPEKP